MSLTKKILISFAIFTVPLFMFLNVWQGYKYERLNSEVKSFEQDQKEWFEKNKKMLAALSVYSSPARVRKIVSENSSLRLQKPGQAIILRFTNEKRHLAEEIDNE
jgi:hypothetical protein